MRPHYHFTAPQNFINDPNGLVYYKGEYHLFYQYNPFGNVHEHLSWGHAISRDYLHWEHLPVALREEGGIEIFSGSAVVDWNNTSGFGTRDQRPLIAIYTGHSRAEQTQNLAYSNDRGRTWNKCADNPVIAIGSRQFRDPKVFWHEPTQRWIMVTALADQQKVRFDGSPDLIHWTHLSNFGPAGSVDNEWECPDMFSMNVDGQPDFQKWILKVDVNHSVLGQYFIGHFDGLRFINYASSEQVLRVDYGKDFYASQSWNDTPDGRRIWIGWMNNWDYAKVIPTSPWRGLLSIPRELHLRRYPEGLRLTQKPIKELKELRQSLYHAIDTDIDKVNSRIRELKMDNSLELQVEFTLGRASECGIKICTDDAEETIIGYNAQAQEIFMDRRYSGDTSFSDKFAAVHRAPLAPEQGKISLHIFVDSCSVEVFANHGRVVISDLIFPSAQNMVLQFYNREGEAHLNQIDIWKLAVANR